MGTGSRRLHSPHGAARKLRKFGPLEPKPKRRGDVLGAEQAARAAGLGHSIPTLYSLPGAFQGVFGGGCFPVVRNWANLLFVSHMGSQMDGEEGVG